MLSPLKKRSLVALIIGTYSLALNLSIKALAFDRDEEKNVDLSTEEMGLVVVEPSHSLRVELLEGQLSLLPYPKRRHKWTKVFGFSIRNHDIQNFSSNYINDSFSFIYGGDPSPGAEFHFVIKKNQSYFSLGLDSSISYLKKDSDLSLIDSSLESWFWKLGLRFGLDALFEDSPFVSPYFAFGIYQALYNEKQEGLINKGSTLLSLYGKVGLLISISWIDPDSSREAYFDSGMEQAYVFLEGGYFQGSFEEKDPDFSGLSTNFGIKLEF